MRLSLNLEAQESIMNKNYSRVINEFNTLTCVIYLIMDYNLGNVHADVLRLADEFEHTKNCLTCANLEHAH